MQNTKVIIARHEERVQIMTDICAYHDEKLKDCHDLMHQLLALQQEFKSL
jgi:hypothetical protein